MHRTFSSCSLAQRHEPVIVERRQEVVLVELGRRCERPCFPHGVLFRSRRSGVQEGALEINGVDCTRRILPPLDRERLDDERATLGWQCPLQTVEKLAEIRTRLGFSRCRPQRKGEVFSRLWRVAMQDQRRKEGLEAVRVD